MTDDERTIARQIRDRLTYRVIARIGFVLAPVMFFLPILPPVITGGWLPWAVWSMTAAFAVLVSASSFAAMARTPLEEQPGVHQLWAVPVAVCSLLPGAVLSFGLQAMIVSLLSQASASPP